MQLEGKIAIITGSGSGIGRGTSLKFAKEGADVVVSDVDVEKAEKVADEVKNLGRKALAYKVDVTNSSEVDNMVKKTLEEFKRVDVLVNNAGIAEEVSFTKMTKHQWDRMFDVHCGGAFNCTRAVLQQMIDQKYGRIISISSIAGLTGERTLVHYSAAKAAIVGFTKALAREVAAHGVTVNAIAPGLIDTPMARGASSELLSGIFQGTLIGRWGRPEDIAAAIVYLASEEASFVTGQVISLNGGLYM